MFLKMLEDDTGFTKTQSKATKFELNKKKRVHPDETLNANEEKVHHDKTLNINEEKVLTLRKKEVSNLAYFNIPRDDDLYYCQDCDSQYKHQCPKHPLFPVKDAKVPPKCKRGLHSGYCLATLPPGLTIMKSKIPHAGLGVFATQFFPARTRFGPYAGQKRRNEEVADCLDYSWNILKDGKISHFVDGSDPKDSNWMRFINCAMHQHPQNVTAYQYQGEIYYRSHMDIHAGTEILVFYGEGYAKDLGIKIQVVDNKCDRNFDPIPQNKDVCQSRKTEGTFANACGPFTTSRINLRKQSHCGTIFNSKDDLQERKVIHSGLKRFKCDLCGKNFKRRDYVTKHMVIHSGLKPFKCDVCGKYFKRKDQVQKHKVMHSSIKPFHCDCGKTFKRNDHFRRHKKYSVCNI